MAKYTGPKCKLCRREGTKLFLKGAKCMSEKCPMGMRNFHPGQHGPVSRRRLSDYGRHLREKQKVKRIYGLLEAQFRRYYTEAARVKGVTGQVLLQMLETRIDNIVYVSGLASSRNNARQLVRQGKISVGGKEVNIPSFQVKKGDIVVRDGVVTTPKAPEEMPVWLEWDGSKNAIIVKEVPAREHINQEINEQLIVEYYSR